MATYEITSPTGEVFEVDAPDDATPEQVQAYFERNYQTAQPATSAPAAPSAPDYEEAKRRAAIKSNADNTFVENVGRGIASGVVGRGVGLLNTVYDIAKSTGAISPENQEIADEAFANTASRVKNWSTGTKVGGAIGELADPANLILGGPGSLALKAAASGAVSAATAPSERRSSVATRLVNAGVGGATGAAVGKAAPLVTKPLAAAGSKLYGLGQRLAVMNGSSAAAKSLVLKQAVEDAIDSGLSPEAVRAEVAKLNKVAPGRSLAEALQVPKMFQRERNVYQSNTPGARQFIDSINTSNANVLRPEAAALREGFDNADPLYAAAEKEYLAAQAAEEAARAAPTELANPAAIAGDVPLQSAVLKQAATPADTEVNRMLEGVRARMKELQGVKGDPEAAVLPLIEQRLANAQGRGLGFKALQELRQQLRTLYIEGAGEATANRANAISRRVADDVGVAMSQRAPSLQAADAEFRKGLKGKELTEMLDKSQGSLQTLKGKLPQAGQDRQQFLEAIPQGEREKVASAMSVAERLANTGYGAGIKTPRTGQLARIADESNLGGDTGLLNPMGFLQRTARHVSEYIQPTLYKEQANFSLGGEKSGDELAAAISKTMDRQKMGSPTARALRNAIAAESGQAVTTTGPYKDTAEPQNGLTSVGNALLNLFGAQDALAPKKRVPTKITISNDPDIGPDGLPRVNLPGAWE